MDKKEITVGLDIGTTKVCTAVASATHTSLPKIVGIGTHKNDGLKKGTVVDIEKTTFSIQKSLEEAQLMAGMKISEASITIAGGHIYSFNSSGVVAIKKNEVQQEDVDRALEAACAVVIPKDREILHTIPQEFCVDNTRNIKDPIGMCGVRLEVHVHIVTAAASSIQNLVKCAMQAGISIKDITLQSIASSHAVLTEEEKEIGVVLVDIGGGTTDIAVWKDSSLLYSQIIPVGGNHFTADLAQGLKVPYNEAEKIKRDHGRVLKESSNQNSPITVQGISGTPPRKVPFDNIANILGARAEELFEIIRDILIEKCFAETVVRGVVLTGGGSLIKGLPVLGEYIIEVPTKVGSPISFGGMTTIMQNPKYSTVLGLLLRSRETTSKKHHHLLSGNRANIMGKLSGPLRTAFREIF